MRIDSIKPYRLSDNNKTNFNNKNSNNNSDSLSSNTELNMLPSYPVFGRKRKTISDYKALRGMKNSFTPEADKIYSDAQKLAVMHNSPTVETRFLYLSLLVSMREFLASIDSGEVKYRDEQRFKVPVAIKNEVSPNADIYSDKKSREKVKRTVDKHIASMENMINAEGKEHKIFSLSVFPSVSKRMVDDMFEAYEVATSEEDSTTFYDSYFEYAARNSSDTKTAADAESLILDLKKEFMLDDTIQKKKHHLQLYDDKADIAWKNISVGNNVAVLCGSDNKSSFAHFLSSFANLVKKPGQHYKNIDPNNTEVLVLGEDAKIDFIEQLVNDIKSDKTKKDKTVIIAGDFMSALTKSGSVLSLEQSRMFAQKDAKNQPKIRFLLTLTPEGYYSLTEQGTSLSDSLSQYSSQSLPALDSNETKKYLTNKKGIAYVKSETERDYDPETIAVAVDITNDEAGNYPDKAIKLLKEVSTAVSEDKEITPDTIRNFVLERRKLSEITSNNSQVNFVADTGKRLKDFVGSPMTKADIESIVGRIKNETIGTKGFMAFLENGTPYGGGRKHTAEVIAGEAEIPMFTINAENFALKDIDALSQNAGLSELKIQRLISDAKAQARANKHKTAMIFIENFDNFAMNPLFGANSIYERKAFVQLMSEMDNARKNDNINLVVVGSVNNPDLIDPNILKPYKFLNSIIIYPPQDADERKEVISYYLDKMKIELEGKDDNEKAALLQNMAETTQGFTVVDLISLLETFKSVAKEKDKIKVDKEVFLEAYLQTVSGRPNKAFMPEHEKRITASHEAGHALTLQIMYEIAEKQDKPWYLPDKVNFITLDPRGSYLGAMYHMDSINRNFTFEKAMSNLICSYGGHSAEKEIYNMPGSWGITGDMEQVSSYARAMVLYMGLGKQTGVIYTPRTKTGEVNVSEAKKQKIDEDIDNITNTAMEISDLIIEEYKPFILEFTEKYSSKVGSGDCTVSSKQFIDELNTWREKQPDDKKQRLADLEGMIINKLNTIKPGQSKR